MLSLSAQGHHLAATVRNLFPYPTAVAVRRADEAGPSDLMDPERQPITPRTSARRVHHLSMGRAAAHAALGHLLGAAQAVPRGEGGQPVWPAGVVGSISHIDALGIAVVGRASHYRSLGVDIEAMDRPVLPAAARLVCTPSERRWVSGEGETPDGLEVTERFVLLFAAKEAIFKALYPLENTWLGFSAADCVWQPEAQTFQATLTTAAARDVPAGTRLTVRCALLGTLAIASLALPTASHD